MRDRISKLLVRPVFWPLIVTLLVISNVVSGGFAWWQYANITNAPTTYPLIDPARHLVAQEHYLTTLQPLREKLLALSEREAARGNNITMYLEYLNTGANVVVNGELRVLPASLVKLPLAFTVMKKVEDGEWRLDDQLVLLPGDADAGSGEMYTMPTGSRFSVESLLRAILRDSDNTAFNIFTRNLDVTELRQVDESLGLDKLFDERKEVSAKEYARFFRALYTASYLNREHSELLLEWLSESAFNEFLVAGVPEGLLFPHKFGLNVKNRVFLDSGIVYLENRPYLLTVMIERTAVGQKEFDRGESGRIMKEISQVAYDYISTQ